MASQAEVQEMLEDILGSDNAYFQPPASVEISYPAIVYSRSKINNTHANNAVYRQEDSYELIVIDYDPDSEIVRRVSRLPKCRHDRHYVADNLNHDVFTLCS